MVDITKWNPYRSQSLFPELARLDELFGGRGEVGRLLESGLPRAAGFRPRVDVAESSEEYTVTAEVPGCDPEQIEVVLQGDRLTLRGEKEEEEERTEGDKQIVERSYGSFERSFTFPAPVDPESVEAEAEHGVLKIHIKKTQRSPAKRIAVKPGATKSKQTVQSKGEVGATRGKKKKEE